MKRRILDLSVGAALVELQQQARRAGAAGAQRSPTGRLNGAQPANQSIPVRTGEGRRVLEAFRNRG